MAGCATDEYVETLFGKAISVNRTSLYFPGSMMPRSIRRVRTTPGSLFGVSADGRRPSYGEAKPVLHSRGPRRDRPEGAGELPGCGRRGAVEGGFGFGLLRGPVVSVPGSTMSRT